ncbi:DUF6671 family protein [Jiella sp. M17.18]|uniref:DUF6671 family protein n=1 Tax=Jiella sp. M17.18 TaxID=3234247 RepID=UPI0034DFCE13
MRRMMLPPPGDGGSIEAQTTEDVSPVASVYAGRRAVLATMHGKEAAIGPSLHGRLGLAVDVATGIDTDSLGTFTGEVPRAGNMDEAAIAKARLGMAASGASIGIASEGSYGPHPQFPFVAAGVELLVFVDDERGLVVRERLVDDAPVYRHAAASSPAGLERFLDAVRFPSHALIVRPNVFKDLHAQIHKGVRTLEELERAVADGARWSGDGLAFVQTDMRAHMNPSRMAVLGRLAGPLAERLLCLCPACGAPGYGVVEAATGLPCAWCGGPTGLVRQEIFGCVACDSREARERPDGLAEADPGQCPACNP